MFHRLLLLMLIYACQARLAFGDDTYGLGNPSTTSLGRFIDPLRSELKVDAAASCAATACHGGPRAGIANEFAVRGSEYPLWIERDPHAKSWRTICGERSLVILQRLNIIRSDGQIADQPGFDNCLACHNTTRQFTDPRSSEMIREGVGCNSCHGPSEVWKSTHYQSTWQSHSNQENGFVQTSKTIARARMCASCHVGDRDRDMNHDIIAAGHPILHYEFTTYHQRLPKHWREPASSDLQRYESTQWMAGQVAALDASLTLLEARANNALPTSQWPDFANYDCVSCHQQLRPGSADYSTGLPEPGLPEPGRAEPGVAKLSLWNRFGVEAVLDARRSSGLLSDVDQRLAESLDELERVSLLSSDISAEEVTTASKSVRWQLDRWLNSREVQNGMTNSEISLSAEQLRGVLIQAGSRPDTFNHWESATQFYLASVAARAAWPDGVRGNSLSTARQLRSVLTFQPGTSLEQSSMWQATSGFKTVPLKAGIQHWHVISSSAVE